jgi:hypothetical protein
VKIKISDFILEPMVKNQAKPNSEKSRRVNVLRFRWLIREAPIQPGDDRFWVLEKAGNYYQFNNSGDYQIEYWKKD